MNEAVKAIIVLNLKQNANNNLAIWLTKLSGIIEPLSIRVHLRGL